MLLKARRDPLPGFVAPSIVYQDLAAALRPPARVSVSECAARHRRLVNAAGGLSGAWSNAPTPYLVEPMNRAVSRDVSELIFVGPAQSAKTELLLSVAAHAIKYSASDVLLVQPTERLAEDFADRRIRKQLLQSSPDLLAELGDERADDKKLTKRFKNGMILTLAWPTAAELAGRPVPIGMIDERDRIADNIDGEGDPVSLLRNRVKTFGRDGHVAVVGSPSRQTHSGIMPLYDAGDRNILFWPCPDCGEFFSPGFDRDRQPRPLEHLVWQRGADGPTAGETVRLACPECGSLIEEKHKRRMLDRSVWIPSGGSIDKNGNIERPPMRGRIASYWLSGIAAAFESWSSLASRYVVAETQFAMSQDESALQALMNTGFGIPYRSRAAGRAAEAREIERRVEKDWKLGEAPRWVQVLTAGVDIQADRFEIGFYGWSKTGESAVIDRFAIRTIGDNRTKAEPGTCPEHWDALLQEAFGKSYKSADGRELKAVRVAIDTGGVAGVSDNAESFYRRARAAGIPRSRIMLVKGSAIREAMPLPKAPTMAGAIKGQRIGVPIWVLGVHRLKDAIANCLNREQPGPGYVHFAADTPARVFAELTGEQRVGGKWQRVGPNETLDTMVYARAAFLRERHRLPALESAAPTEAADEQAKDDKAETAANVAPLRRVSRVKRRGGFVRGF